MHYHVGHNMAGYMPESDVYTHRTLRQARSASLSDLKFDMEQAWDTYHGYTAAERRDMGIKRPTYDGRSGDYWTDFGEGRATFHYWVSDPCDCTEGEDELSAE